MSDIPQMYLDEAIRRLNNGVGLDVWARDLNDNPTLRTLARTLQELGWQPPVDPMLVRAREIAAKCWADLNCTFSASQILDGTGDCEPAVQAALIALREGMGK